MTFVEGIGGAFIFSKDPTRLATWYTDNLGLEFEGDAENGVYYQVFWALDTEDPNHKMDTTFSIMRATRDFANPAKSPEPDNMYGDQPFMVNVRVRDIDALIAHLGSKGIDPIKRMDEVYGRFAWIRDADGNRVELYEPLSQVDDQATL